MLANIHTTPGGVTLLTLAVGMTFGFCFAYLILSPGEQFCLPNPPNGAFEASSLVGDSEDDLETWQPKNVEGIKQNQSDESAGGLVLDMSSSSYEKESQEDEYDVTTQVAKRVRVLCWVMTGPKNHKKKCPHVKATWGKRCDILLFMSSANDSALPAIKLPVQEGRDWLWAKTKEAFKYIYKHHINDADWFMKADDDTYVVVENLRNMLSAHQPTEPIFFGHRAKNGPKLTFMSGGAGYVLSREALRLFSEKGVNDSKICRQDHKGGEDVEIGICMEHLGVISGDSRDSLGRGRFFPLVPEKHLIPGYQGADVAWYKRTKFYPAEEGMGCCSDSAISFHYISPNQMYVMEYLIYHLKPIQNPVYEESAKGISLSTGITVNSTTLKIGSNKTNSNS